MKDDILDLFKEFESDIITISDLGLQYRGVNIDCIIKNTDNTVSLWAGNPDTDKYAEELLPEREERKLILEQIIELM